MVANDQSRAHKRHQLQYLGAAFTRLRQTLTNKIDAAAAVIVAAIAFDMFSRRSSLRRHANQRALIDTEGQRRRNICQLRVAQNRFY